MTKKPTFGETINAAVAARRQRGIERVFGTPTGDTESPDQAMLNRLFPNRTDNNQGDNNHDRED